MRERDEGMSERDEGVSEGDNAVSATELFASERNALMKRNRASACGGHAVVSRSGASVS
jgi:hypothetical protein